MTEQEQRAAALLEAFARLLATAPCERPDWHARGTCQDFVRAGRTTRACYSCAAREVLTQAGCRVPERV